MTDSSMMLFGPYRLKVDVTGKGISNIRISKQPFSKTKNKNNIIVQFLNALKKFRDGDARAFTNIPLDAVGTEFQKKVWDATCEIPYGETRTYAQIAKAIGLPKAVRAVGTALGKNPVCIVVPCHRVVPSSGGIGQYAYGKQMTQWLLNHESGRIA